MTAGTVIDAAINVTFTGDGVSIVFSTIKTPSTERFYRGWNVCEYLFGDFDLK